MFTQTYASHVMQTALSVANKYLSQSIEEGHNALEQRPDQEPLEALGTLINLFVENILGQLSTVCTDVNGSHVLRYLLCILMGCPHRFGDIKKHTEKGVQKSFVCLGLIVIIRLFGLESNIQPFVILIFANSSTFPLLLPFQKYLTL